MWWDWDIDAEHVKKVHKILKARTSGDNSTLRKSYSIKSLCRLASNPLPPQGLEPRVLCFLCILFLGGISLMLLCCIVLGGQSYSRLTMFKNYNFPNSSASPQYFLFQWVALPSSYSTKPENWKSFKSPLPSSPLLPHRVTANPADPTSRATLHSPPLHTCTGTTDIRSLSSLSELYQLGFPPTHSPSTSNQKEISKVPFHFSYHRVQTKTASPSASSFPAQPPIRFICQWFRMSLLF
jgi:hypothetical protein